MSGNLAFGEVTLGASRSSVITISNSGNSALTITGFSVTGGLAAHSTSSWTSGTIAAGGSQNATIRFAPTAAGAFSGTVQVNGDQTSGSNSIAMSGSSANNTPFAGVFSGTYIVERCDGTGSVQDYFCSSNRGLFPVGTPLPIRLSLTQSGSSVAGRIEFGQITGSVSGLVTGGTLVLQGNAASSAGVNVRITSWSTALQGNLMVGSVRYDLTLAGTPGVASLTTRLNSVSK